jgi:Uma2 family endonuclease
MSISYNDPTTKLTYDHYVLFPNDGNRHEIIHGRHHMNPAPSPRHQFASRHIQFQLFNQIELKGLGQVINAPIDVQLSETDVVQPDLVVVLNDNRIITTTKVNGPPDLVVEILSPSNREYDQVLKKRLYEQYGVPEYWIVDPDNRTADQHVLAKESITYCVTTCATEIRFAKVKAVVNLGRVWL